MPIDDDDMILKTADYLVTENTLNEEASADEMVDWIKRMKVTGDLVLTFTTTQGGLRKVVLVERTKVAAAESNEVRRVMGMDYEVEVEPPKIKKLRS
jgi:hypothetical protein